MRKMFFLLTALLMLLSFPAAAGMALAGGEGDGVRPGSVVLFGKYEQDNDLTNGPEEIRWIVLDVQDGRALLIIQHILDCQQYNAEFTETTWEKCTLRKWLNDSFGKTAFSGKEWKSVLLSAVKADENPTLFYTDPGRDTEDRIFLLSVPETDTYFASDEDRVCTATAYAEAQGCDTYEGRCWWWLRSPGDGADFAAAVNGIGSADGVCSPVYDDGGPYDSFNGYIGVRPALWVDLRSASLQEAPEEDPAAWKKEEEVPEVCVFPPADTAVGEYVTFGTWEQDNDKSNGSEPIEWLVLAKEDGRILVISRYSLDYQPFSGLEGTWETCSLRYWLNGKFLNTAFSEGEREGIPAVTVHADPNPEYGTDPGSDTEDRVFVLSVPEAALYFPSEKGRIGEPSGYVAGKTSSGLHAWWLRTPGENQGCAARVSFDGSFSGNWPVNFSSPVRPAIWIQVD